MIQLNRLYSEPEIFDPIEFGPGVNLILGEKVEEKLIKTRKDKKTNGVGKSMCIEFINFCLLNKINSSRLSRIPEEVFSYDTEIILEMWINKHQVTIIRTINKENQPRLIIDGEKTDFSSLEDAWRYLESLIFEEDKILSLKPTFRSLLGPIIRDEDSEFRDIIYCYDLKNKVQYSDLIKPHLYLFNIKIDVVDQVKKLITEIKKAHEYLSGIKRSLTNNGDRKISEVKADVNSLEAEVGKINKTLEAFKTNEAFESIQNDILDLESSLDSLRIKQKALRYELARINNFPTIESVETSDIELLYNQFKNGLGEQIVKTIEEVLEFKSKINQFEFGIFEEKREILKKDLEKTTEKIIKFQDDLTKKLLIVDQKGLLKDFKTAVAVYNQKNSEFGRLKSQLTEFEDTERKGKSLEREKDNILALLDGSIFESKNIITSFNKTLVEAHEFIMGNSVASFDIKTVENKNIVKFEYRISDDGSRSVDRTKVFIYDVGLMLNEYTSKKHSQLLIHDNIFDVDQDTLVQSLNFLNEQDLNNNNFQYILTLNRDKIENEERKNEINMDIDSHVVARFTRQNTFLKKSYQEK